LTSASASPRLARGINTFERKETAMSDPKPSLPADPKPADPPATPGPPTTIDPLFRFDTPLFGGHLTGGARELSPGLFLGNADYLFRNSDRLGGELRLGTDPGFSIEQYGLNGNFGLGGSGRFDFDALAAPSSDTYRLGTKFDWNPDFRLNADWQRTQDGQTYGADGAFRLGRDGNGTASFRVDEPANTAKFDTRLQLNPDFRLNADWLRTQDGQIYGADSAFRLGREGNGTASFRVDEPANTAKFDTRLQFNPDFRLNADWLRTHDGQIYGADGAFRLGRDGNGTASFRVDEPANTAKFDTRLQFNPDFRLNADWLRTQDGQIYGADGAFRLGREGNGTASFRVDEPANTAKFDTRLQFNPDFRLNADWLRTQDGQIYGADGAFRLGREGNGTARFRVDEPAGTTMFDTRLRFDNGFGLNADYTQHRDGAVYGADTTFRLGRDGSGTGGFRVDERNDTASLNSRLLFGNGNALNFDLSKTPQGMIYGGDGSFGLGRDGRGLASFRIDEPNGSSQYKLGASFANGNAFNGQLMADRLGTSLGFDARLGFDRGNGSLGLDGKFGPKSTDLGASVNFRNKDLEYSALLRADNASGAFRVSEFGAKIATLGNDRYKLSAEAGYRPDTREAYGKIGLTISFGGGSKPSRPITRAADPGFDPEAAVDRAVADFREKQAILLRPENRALYDQAVAGVQKLNREGAQLPVQETAASLAALAKAQGIDIKYVALGKPTADGRQNLFIGDGDPSQPGTRQAFVDKTQAATTPMDDSLRRLSGEPAQKTGAEPPAQDAIVPAARRGG
jgi:hypothetical protein